MLELLNARHPVEIVSDKFKYQPQKGQVLKNPTLSSHNSRYKNTTSEFFLSFYFKPLVFISNCLFLAWEAKKLQTKHIVIWAPDSKTNSVIILQSESKGESASLVCGHFNCLQNFQLLLVWYMQSADTNLLVIWGTSVFPSASLH